MKKTILAILMTVVVSLGFAAPAQAATLGGYVANSVSSNSSFYIEAVSGNYYLPVGQANSAVKYWYLAPGCSADKYINGVKQSPHYTVSQYYAVYAGESFALIYKC